MVIYHFCPRKSEVNRDIQREREREGEREGERERERASVARHEVERLGAASMD
jgi:hypothetical protein